jgi:NitT/TauT family transport system permease protein
MNAPFQRDLDRRGGVETGTWEFIERTTQTQPKPTLPAPHQVAQNFLEEHLPAQDHVEPQPRLSRRVTLSSTLLGFAFGTLLGIVIAVGIVHVWRSTAA